MRDIRDVLVSSYFHLKYREKLINKDISSFIRDEYLGIKKVISFMNLWHHNRTIPKDYTSISYEQLHYDTIKVFRKIIEFINIEIDQEMLSEAVEFASFKNMQNMEATTNTHIPWLKPGNKNDLRTYKTRKGKIGSFKDELSEDDIGYLNQLIKAHLAPELKTLIYNESI